MTTHYLKRCQEKKRGNGEFYIMSKKAIISGMFIFICAVVSAQEQTIDKWNIKLGYANYFENDVGYFSKYKQVKSTYPTIRLESNYRFNKLIESGLFLSHLVSNIK